MLTPDAAEGLFCVKRILQCVSVNTLCIDNWQRRVMCDFYS